ncbi:restriction endonuclease subunit S [Bacillus toyonensis]|uniref:restriction endonuclease subunit S n=1 Tax=Bacillus toyonensis TaxID=155322 RepID=UPI0010390C52|nr:restriction endonuclease subunit S [Bacillus toyonensis]MCU5304757.1 restriction endonuclease subunit S [Bacillus toyonensis]TBX46471.1 hypothetical protein E0M44_16250 [Bacillus toyonensis]
MANKKNSYSIEEVIKDSKTNDEFMQFNLLSNWCWVKLGVLAEFIDYRGKTPKKTTEGIRLITAKNIRMNKLKFEPLEFISEEDYDNWMTRGIPKKGDILLTTEAPLGNVAELDTDEKVALAQRVITLVPKDAVHNRYLKIILQSPQLQHVLSKNSTGTTVSGIKASRLKDIKIPLPPFNEQKRIAEKVKRLLSKIEDAKHLIEEVKETFELRRAAILDNAFRGRLGTNEDDEYSMMGAIGKDNCISKVDKLYEVPENWVYVKLGKVVEFQGGSQPPKSVFKDEQLDGYIRLIQIRDFKSDKFKTYIPKELARRTFDENDVMIGRYGPPVFQILRGLSGAYNVALMKAIPINNLMDNDYLYYFLQVPFIQNPVIKDSHRTAGQTGIRKELIEDFVIGLPPLNEQKRIVEKVERLLDKMEFEKISTQIAMHKLEELKQSILSKAFQGELGTNDPNKENTIELLKKILQEQVK